jgi:hypothetical protein
VEGGREGVMGIIEAIAVTEASCTQSLIARKMESLSVR